MVRPTSRLMSSRRDTGEEELVAACRRGERRAQRELFEKHNVAVFRALLALSGDSGVAEDLLQETFLKAYGAIGGFRGHSSVRTWLMRIGTNAFYADRRREQTRRRHLSQIGVEGTGAGLRIVASVAEDRQTRLEFRDLVLRGLGGLSATDRTVLTLHDIEGYRYAEIAEILDVAPGTVGSRLSRARQRLAAALRELLGLGAEETLTLEHLYSDRTHSLKQSRKDPEDARRNGEK